MGNLIDTGSRAHVAFRDIMRRQPGPDAARIVALASSAEEHNVDELTRWVDDSIRAIERVGREEERGFLPAFRALSAELHASARTLERTERGNLVSVLSPEEAARRARERQAIPDPDAARDDGGE